MRFKKNYFKTTVLIILSILFFFTLALNYLTRQNNDSFEQQTFINIAYASSDSTFSSTIDEIIRTFETTHPNIQIISSSLTEKNFPIIEEKNLYLTNSWPDIIELADFQTAKELEVIAPFSPNFLSEISEENLIKDQQGIPWLASTQEFSGSEYYRIYYNKQLFNELGVSLPQTYDEFLTICDTLLERNIVPLGISGSDNRGIQTLFTMLLAEFIYEQPDFFQNIADNKSTFTAEYLAIFNQVKSLLARYSAENWQSTTEIGAIDDFQHRRTAMLVVSSLIEPTVEDSAYFQLDDFPMPSQTTGQHYSIEDAFGGGWALSVDALTQPEKQQAMLEFLSFYYSQEVQKIFQAADSFGPVIESHGEKPLTSVPQQNRLLESDPSVSEAITTPLPFNDISYLYHFFTLQNQILKNYINGEISDGDLPRELAQTWKSLDEVHTDEK